MTKVTPLVTVLACPLVLGAVVTPAQAQLARTFVSALGNDGNDCNRPTPCRTFQVAHDKTLANGEITVLDPGGYGAVTITKTISIINDGVGEAGVLVSGGGNGITINAGAGDAISLRGLTLKGIGFGGGNGIVFNTGNSLTIENCVLRNFTGTGTIGRGLVFQPGAASKLAVSNTLAADNQGVGLLIQPTGAGAVNAVFNRVEAFGNSLGIRVVGSSATGTLDVAVADSVSASNAASGFEVFSSLGHAVTSLMVTGSVSANNSFGVFASGSTATLRVGETAVTGNDHSWNVENGALLRSYGDNNIDGNGDGDPAIPTVIVKK